MDKLNEAIVDTAYILDCLRCLRAIYETGDCNNCGIEAVCKVKPLPGQMVRYNCPFYKKDGEQHE